MAYPNIEAILEEGGDITFGRVGPIDCVASATTSYDCPVMLVRREGESFVALLRRLDRSIAKAWEQEIPIDEVNGRRPSGQQIGCDRAMGYIKASDTSPAAGCVGHAGRSRQSTARAALALPALALLP